MGGYNKRGYLNSDFKIFHLTDQISTEFEFHYHEFHKITIFISGNVQYFVEGKTYPLEPYDIVLVNRNDIHRVQVDPSLPYERIIVYISPGFIDAYRTDDYDLSYCFEKKQKKEHSKCAAHFILLEKKALFSKITNRLVNVLFLIRNMPAVCTGRFLFLEFMIHLNRAAIKNRVEFLDTRLYNPKIVDLIQYINQHLTQTLNVDFLSSRVYLSKYYMMRLFKAETGYTIGNYITYRRLLLARTLILDGMPITQACLASGFQDYSTFSRAYKTEFHEPPRTLLHHSD